MHFMAATCGNICVYISDLCRPFLLCWVALNKYKFILFFLRLIEIEDDDYMGKKAEICGFDEKVRQEFGTFLHCANNLMKKMQVDLADVKVTWSGYEEKMSEEARQASDISSFLLALRGNQGPYAYGNLSALLILFCGKEGEKLVAEYEEKLECQLRPRVIPTQRKGKKFIVKVDGRLDLTKELAFRNTLAKLFKCSPKDFLLEDIHHGSTILTYIIPAEVAESIQARIAASVEELKNAKILQLILEGYAICVFRYIMNHVLCSTLC